MSKDFQLKLQKLVNTINIKEKHHQSTKIPQDISKVQKIQARFYRNHSKIKTEAKTISSKFRKHNNLVQTNKQNIHRLNNFKMSDDENFPKEISQQSQSLLQFQPQTEEQIRHRYKHTYNEDDIKIVKNSQNLQSILIKKCLNNKRGLMNYNILKLQNKYNFSRFQLHNLHSTYKTLLFNSKFSIKRFKTDFQVMLNINKIHVRTQILDKIFKEQKRMNFEDFIEMYNNIDQIIYKQNIIDYVQILFEGIYDKNNIRYEDIIRILKHRVTEKEAMDIASIIYDEIDRQLTSTVKLTQITYICQYCENFAKKMYLLYSRETKND